MNSTNFGLNWVRKRKRSVGTSDLTKIVFDLPTSVDEEFAQSLRTHLVEQTTKSWMFWYGLLENFIREYGHCRVPQGYTTDDGYRLGGWVRRQRDAQDTMDVDRRQRLEALPGWSWDPFSDQWEEGFSYLREYSNREGHCRVPPGYTTDDGYRLGQWVSIQREAQDTMDVDRRQRLEALPGWSWDLLSDQWEEGFAHLKEFSEPRRSLSSAPWLHDRRRLSPRSVGFNTESGQGHDGR